MKFNLINYKVVIKKFALSLLAEKFEKKFTAFLLAPLNISRQKNNYAYHLVRKNYQKKFDSKCSGFKIFLEYSRDLFVCGIEYSMIICFNWSALNNK